MSSNEKNQIDTLKDKLSKIDGILTLRTQQKPFDTKPIFDKGNFVGVDVSNLGKTYNFLPFEVFVVTISLLHLSKDKIAINGTVMRRNMTVKLGEPELPINSVEGHIANTIYGKKIGDSIFRRITPIIKILEWADICEIGKGNIRLK